MIRFEVGDLVQHSLKPQLGVGVVDSLDHIDLDLVGVEWQGRWDGYRTGERPWVLDRVEESRP